MVSTGALARIVVPLAGANTELWRQRKTADSERQRPSRHCLGSADAAGRLQRWIDRTSAEVFLERFELRVKEPRGLVLAFSISELSIDRAAREFSLGRDRRA